MKIPRAIFPLAGILLLSLLPACRTDLENYLGTFNPVWESPGPDASASMPCGGGDIGLNVWVQDGDVLFYIARSGNFDENNTLVKLGRIRMRFSPNPFTGKGFRQELVLEDGYVRISGQSGDQHGELLIWVDVYRPVIHADFNSGSKVKAEISYENWRYKDLYLREGESRENSYRWVPPDSLVKRRDSIRFSDEGVLFYHRNRSPTVFDITVAQQGMDSVKEFMYDPLAGLTYGGRVRAYSPGIAGFLKPAGTFGSRESFLPAGKAPGRYLDTEFMGWKLQSREPCRKHALEIFLHTQQAGNMDQWHAGLRETMEEEGIDGKKAFRESRRWWNRFWERSFIAIQPGHPDPAFPPWQAGRNYQLFRYMLGCNAYGEWPTKFNGGLFTYDPGLIRGDWPFTPDFRNWGGGTFTAQNQRLVYFPMLKSGDFDLMKPQLDFYLRTMGNAVWRSRVYWGHGGACFTEQLENFGLPNCTEYGWQRPSDLDPGMQHNAWLEYQWDTALEFCLMILQLHEYTGQDITGYIPLIESCLEFYDAHYRYLARQRGDAELDSAGRLVIYPGSACETYKGARNPASTVAALQQVLAGMLELPEQYPGKDRRNRWRDMQKTIPPVPLRELGGKTLIAPAESWERVQNTEIPQLYPVFPWRIYGVGREGLDTALNTWNLDPDVKAFRSHLSWKQYGIMAACMGLEEEALDENIRKLQDSERRFPAFWGPGMDWVPDHNWGGSGMIGLQEMLLQADGQRILLFPAWPGDLDVHFRLHAPHSTIVEGRLKDGKPEILRVHPRSRAGDVEILRLNKQPVPHLPLSGSAVK